MQPLSRRYSLFRGIAIKCHLRALPTNVHGELLMIPLECWRGWKTIYESYMADAIRKHLSSNGGFIDIGAHHGIWSAFATKQMGKQGKNLAFEPSPAFDVLIKQAQIYPKINAIRKGVGAHTGKLTFYPQGDSSSGSFVREVTEINQHFLPDTPITSEDVVLTTLDEELKCMTSISQILIKVDVEGFEYEVLKGARDVLNDQRVTWVIEIHPPQLEKSGSSADEVEKILTDNDLTIEIIDRNKNSLYTILATK